MTVTAVQLQTVVDTGAVSDRVLEREHEEPIRAQCSCDRRDDALQVAEIHERVGRHDQVEGFAIIAQVLRQLGFHQRVVDVLVLRVRQHPFGQIHADQPARKRRDERAAKSRSTSRVQHVEAMRGLKAAILQHCRDERRRTIRQPLELRLRSSPQNCRRLPRRNHLMRVRAHLDPCRPPACAAQSDLLALLRAILRRSSPPRRSRPACSAPAPAAFALRGASV